MSKTTIIDKIIIAVAAVLFVILMITAKNIYTSGWKQQPDNDLKEIKKEKQNGK